MFRDEPLLIREKSPFHSVLFADDFCQIFQDNQMDVHIRTWDSVKYQTNDCYLTSKFQKSINAENF